MSTADTPASGKDSRAGSSRPLTAAEKQLAKQASEALRKLNAVNLGEASKIQKQLADIVKVSALPPGFIENLNRSVVPKFSARLLDTPSFKLASANLLKGFDFGGVTAAADLVAKANFGWNSQLQAVTSQLAKQHSAWLKSLVKLDFRLPYPPNLEGIEDLRLAEIEQVILVEGIPLYGIPRKAIAEASSGRSHRRSGARSLAAVGRRSQPTVARTSTNARRLRPRLSSGSRSLRWTPLTPATPRRHKLSRLTRLTRCSPLTCPYSGRSWCPGRRSRPVITTANWLFGSGGIRPDLERPSELLAKER